MRKGGGEGERAHTYNGGLSCKQEDVILWRSLDHNQSLQMRQKFLRVSSAKPVLRAQVTILVLNKIQG